MLPFTPRQKDNLAAWMVARSDGEHYGKLVVFQFPKQKVVFGPRQVVARINQDQVISPQITLWNQQGSQVIQGTLLVDPDRGVAALRPAALPARRGRADPRAEAGDRGLPEPDRDGGDARRRARAHLPLGGRTGRRRGGPPTRGRSRPRRRGPGALGDLGARAREHYQRALQAQREGDWALYGEEIRRLGEVLERMRERP